MVASPCVSTRPSIGTEAPGLAIYLLDTSAFSRLMRDDPGLQARVAGLSGADSVAICSIVRGEILYGIDRLPQGARRKTLDMRAQQLFGRFACEPVNAAVADHYAQFKRAMERAGTAMDKNDLWIAATAHLLGAVLVTTDSDYSHLAALTIEDWTRTGGPGA